VSLAEVVIARAIVLSRAIDDEALSDEILTAVRKGIGELR
jgi:hypothetical protein